MDSIGNILSGKDVDQPQEVQDIKDYAKRELKAKVEVAVNASSIIISANNASLINTLRLQTLELQKIANTSKKFIFRIRA